MRKKIIRSFATLFAVLFCIGALTGCGGSKYDAASTSYKSSAPRAEANYTAGDVAEDYGYFQEAGNFESEESSYSNGNDIGKENTDYLDNNSADSSRKLIKRVSLNIETLEFDKSVSMIEDYVRLYHGYIENSSVHNNDYYATYYDRRSSRTASYTIRIPNGMVDQFVSNAGNIGSIISNATSTEDITLGYLDVESRAKALKIQQERLLALLEEATSVDEIISLEDRISEVTYELESRESTLRNYDNLVSYSTVNISLNEVTRITDPVPETVGERISTGFKDTIYDITEGLKDFIVWFVVNLPYIIIFLLVIALAALIIIGLVKFFKKLGLKRYAKQQQKLQEKQEAYARQQAKMRARQAEAAAKQAEEQNK